MKFPLSFVFRYCFTHCILALWLLTTFTSTSAATCIDNDNDGWGWDGTTSCYVGATNSTPDTVACIDHDNDGWGWYGTSSCQVTHAVEQNQNSTNLLDYDSPTCIDDDNDGWGWDGTASCYVGATNSTPDTAACIDHDNDGWGWNGTFSCRVNQAVEQNQNSTNLLTNDSPTCIDDDNDGWGWDGTASCRTQNNTESIQTNNANASSCFDDDNDGWGWNGSSSCYVDNNNNNNNNNNCIDPDNDGWGWNGSGSCRSQSNATSNSASGPGQITDLVLVTGQSNALGAGTDYNASLDAPHSRVYAFTNNGWQVANLHQVWDHNQPRNHQDTDPSNNFSLHFGKQLTQLDSSRVIGIILATAPGESISHWSYGGNFYNSISTKVTRAINQLPHKSALDGILWHQGESDGKNDAAYGHALYRLIEHFRSEPWFLSGRPFICGETAAMPVNVQLNALNRDADPTTACVKATDLSTVHDGIHFDAAALRAIGQRYAQRYLSIVNR